MRAAPGSIFGPIYSVDSSLINIGKSGIFLLIVAEISSERENMAPLPSTFVEGFHDAEAVQKMKYYPLGETGLLLSHLGFGGGGLANFYE